MKKLLMTVLMLVGVATFAVEVTKEYNINPVFQQFTAADYNNDIPRDRANVGSLGESYIQYYGPWGGTALFTLDVKGGTGVWLSNYISNNYGGVIDLDKNIYNMSPKAYGYIYEKDMPSLIEEKPNYDSLIHPSNGATTTITYTSLTADGEGKYPTVSTEGYFLDYFEEDAKIYLVMTTLPEDGGEKVDTYQFVQDNNAYTDTTLKSRQHNTSDIAGNIRVNFGIDLPPVGDGNLTDISREFVAVYSGDSELIRSQIGGGTAGGPLPGVFFAGLLSLGTVFGASKVKRQKRA